LAEAGHFAAAGYADIIYAVGIAPQKLGRVVELRRQGVDLAVLLDSVAQAEAVAEASRRAGMRIPALIEIDCDGHRGGIRSADPSLVAIGRVLEDGGAELRGVLDHAGESYFASTPDAQRQAADTERGSLALAAEALRAASLPCPVLSAGSTPTAFAPAGPGGITEVRAGVFVFFDLVMAGIGICSLDDLALSVVVTVIGHRRDKGWVMTDGGWMAMSRDRGTARQAIDQGYGMVTDLRGTPLPHLLMIDATQEHGILAIRAGSETSLPDLPVGTRLRILPNHACATAAQHQEYQVVSGGNPGVEAVWPSFGGW
jgi:D-serine deaminase-like pyridoxal phosphate-dependent protein